MIYAKFFVTKEGFFKGFNISGHSFFSEYGSDIVCAGVSCSVQMCCNAITDILTADVDVICEKNRVNLKVNCKDDCVQSFLKALKLQLAIMQKNYSKNISLKILEV